MKNSHLGVEKPGYDELAGLERKVLSRFLFEEEMGSQGQRPHSRRTPASFHSLCYFTALHRHFHKSQQINDS